MYKISIIIPIYNAGEFLKQCLDSIINQTMNFKEFEIIMIDDASTDNSLSIMEEYSKRYDNFITIKLPTCSGGAGKPRNEGLKIAKAKYVMFTDPDDFYTQNACELMYKTIEEKNGDYVTFNYRNTDEDGTLWENPIFSSEIYNNIKLDITDYDKSFFVMNSSVCNKIFNREFIEKNDIKFLEEGMPAEDAFFSMSAFLASKNAYYDKNVVYNYRQRTKSNTSISNNCSREYFRRINKAYKQIYSKFKEYNQLGFYRFYYAKNMTYMLYKFIDSKLLTNDDRVEILEEMRWFYELSDELNVPACQTSLSILIKRIILRQYNDVIDVCRIISDIRAYMAKDTKDKMTKPSREMYEIISNLTKK